MLVSNTKVEPLRDLFERLNLLYGLLHHLQDKLKLSKSSISETIEKNNFNVANLYAGYSVTIRDLTLVSGKGFNDGAFITGQYVTKGEEYIRVIDLLLSRDASWAISQAYEAFETFLLDQYAFYLLANPKCVDTGKYSKKVRVDLAKDHLMPDKIEYWKIFTRSAKYNCLKVLEIMRSLCPQLVEIEKANSFQIDLVKWSKVVTEVGHAVTHSNMVIKPEIMTKWSSEEIHILNAFFPGNTITKGYELNVKVDDAEKSLELFGSYGLILYKLLNGFSGKTIEIFCN
jgi:hypothetical protein